MKDAIRVLLVDDSAVVRGMLTRVLEADPDIRVAGSAMHGRMALDWLRRHPVDVVVLDVEMPVLDGLQTLLQLQSEFPQLPVIMASSMTVKGAETTVRALKLGAAGCIAKPRTGSVQASMQQLATELNPLVKTLGARRPVGEIAGAAARTPREAGTTPDDSTYHIVVIGASTGGPNALTRVLTRLPEDFTLPICIVQHMPPTFTPLLAAHLEKDTGRPCREAIAGELLQSGRMYVAPGDYHLSLCRQHGRILTMLDHGSQQHYCRPSVNPLFQTASRLYGAAVLAVMLTGMGEDGLEGAREVVARNGYLIAQDKASSVVWGMPGAVVRERLAHRVLPLDEIAAEMRRVGMQQVVRT
jgi:two-component system, chemotaxis family, protein-glutamate methylesterase/glutaminase